MGKSFVTPTNIEPELKKFLLLCKSKGFKREYDMLYSYLEENPRFVKDFEEFKNGL
jgi:hypothetical protein